MDLRIDFLPSEPMEARGKRATDRRMELLSTLDGKVIGIAMGCSVVVSFATSEPLASFASVDDVSFAVDRLGFCLCSLAFGALVDDATVDFLGFLAVAAPLVPSESLA